MRIRPKLRTICVNIFFPFLYVHVSNSFIRRPSKEPAAISLISANSKIFLVNKALIVSFAFWSLSFHFFGRVPPNFFYIINFVDMLNSKLGFLHAGGGKPWSALTQDRPPCSMPLLTNGALPKSIIRPPLAGK